LSSFKEDSQAKYCEIQSGEVLDRENGRKDLDKPCSESDNDSQRIAMPSQFIELKRHRMYHQVIIV
jgi:hypothetical protein